MTLDEAIKHAEEVAEENEKISLYTPVEFIPADLSIEQCQNCAEEHRQLAEWLKDYKRLLEQEPFMNKPCIANQICHEDKIKVLDKISAEIAEEAKGTMNGNRAGGLYKALQIIDKYKASPTGAESEDKE